MTDEKPALLNNGVLGVVRAVMYGQIIFAVLLALVVWVLL